MGKFKLLSPWQIYVRKLKALFAEDEEVIINLDEEKYNVRVYVDGNEAKANALDKLIGGTVDFGNVTLKISVIPSNSGISTVDLLKDALSGNNALDSVREAAFPGGKATYFVFKREVVQYPADDISSLHGVQSTLYENLAKEIFNIETGGVFFCTDDM